MNYKEKCDFLYRLIDDPDDIQFQSNTQVIFELSKDKISFIRSLVAKLLIDHVNQFSKNVLLELSSDKDNLVRVEAVDSLRVFIDEVVYLRLKHLAEFDNYYLTRAYSIYSLTIIGVSLKQDGLSEFITSRIKLERYIINKISCSQSLYILGRLAVSCG